MYLNFVQFLECRKVIAFKKVVLTIFALVSKIAFS